VDEMNTSPDISKSDDVKPEIDISENGEKVVQEKLVYYCSSFDLNVNEWFTEYENAQIFKKRMKQKLGNLLPQLTITFRPELG
jgi:hypothetical protein